MNECSQQSCILRRNPICPSSIARQARWLEERHVHEHEP
jgi:hypothetical protein